MGAMSRNKGKVGEREWARFCTQRGYEAHRTAQCRGDTGQAADVEGLPGIHIEVKRTESLRLYDALAQSRHDAAVGDHGIPIVAHRRNDEDWVVIMMADDWFALYKAWEENPTATDISGTVRDDHIEFKCSRCRATIGCVEGGSLDGAKFNYCPGCGAKLVYGAHLYRDQGQLPRGDRQ